MTNSKLWENCYPLLHGRVVGMHRIIWKINYNGSWSILYSFITFLYQCKHYMIQNKYHLLVSNWIFIKIWWIRYQILDLRLSEKDARYLHRNCLQLQITVVISKSNKIETKKKQKKLWKCFRFYKSNDKTKLIIAETLHIIWCHM